MIMSSQQNSNTSEKSLRTKDIQIILPKMGESVMEAIVTSWMKEVGDRIEKDEAFVTIGTDKVDSELPSEYEGILKEILVEEGDEVKVGHPIAILEVAADTVVHEVEVVSFEETTAVESKEDIELLVTKNIDGKSFLSPVVRRIAAENGLEVEDLKKITPTGDNGRIRKVDILRYLKKDEKPVQQVDASIEQKLDLNIQPEDTVEALPRIRQLAAEYLQSSYQTIPHVTTFIEVNVTNMVNYRNGIKEDFIKENGVNVTYTHFIMQAVIETLKEYPKFNAWMNVDELITKNDINLGFATALPDGNLIVPNVKKVNDMSLKEIIENVNLIGNNAKSNKLKATDIQDTTFTVSNTGIFGSLMGTPIISRPQVAVLALGIIRSGAGVVEVNGKEELAVCKMMMLSLSYDHRVIDGALASQFLSTLKNKLEKSNWD